MLEFLDIVNLKFWLGEILSFEHSSDFIWRLTFLQLVKYAVDLAVVHLLPQWLDHGIYLLSSFHSIGDSISREHLLTEVIQLAECRFVVMVMSEYLLLSHFVLFKRFPVFLQARCQHKLLSYSLIEIFGLHDFLIDQLQRKLVFDTLLAINGWKHYGRGTELAYLIKCNLRVIAVLAVLLLLMNAVFV